MLQPRGAWGVPDFGILIDRTRVRSEILRHGMRPCVLWGPSGCGKSVAAAQYGTHADVDTLWVHVGGRSISVAQCVELMIHALKGQPPRQDGLIGDRARLIDMVDAVVVAMLERHGTKPGRRSLIVVDDLGLIPKADGDALGEVAVSLWQVGVQLLVTTRTTDGWSADSVCAFGVIGPEELALTQPEAVELLASVDPDGVAKDALGLCESCSGHVAFFRLLAAQAKSHGLESSCRTTSLDAWLSRVIDGQMRADDRSALIAAALLGSGSDEDLESMGVPGARMAMKRVTDVLPLVSLLTEEDGCARFTVHDLVVGFFSGEDDRVFDAGSLRAAINVLTQRGDYPRASRALLTLTDAQDTVEWLGTHGRSALEAGHGFAVDSLVRTVPMATMLGHPELLLLAAEVCAETGRVDDALAKASAARSLAEHSGDLDTVSRALAASLRMWGEVSTDEALALASATLNRSSELPPLLHAEALASIGKAKLYAGDYSGAEEPLRNAVQMAGTCEEGRNIAAIASHGLALLPGISNGDFVESVHRLRPLVDNRSARLSYRICVRGNMALCLIETGRLSRCDSLLKRAIDDARRSGLQALFGSYLCGRGCLELARGRTDIALADLQAGISNSIDSGQEADAAQTRVYLSSALRACAQPAAALEAAERAFEWLDRHDMMSFRRLAALEIAASLLALGDPAAARSWAETVIEEGFAGNLHHAMRADMVLAEIERQEDQVDTAIARLARNRDHILSENSNWQIAMYCRAFPELLGVFALALGVENLPVHMLRMILPEHAEQSLVSSKSFMDEGIWQALGTRLLGEAEVAKLVLRKGLPLCHVRLFGGLEVSVGGRTIRERDWKKRKARLLFTMLVTRRGQDVPRDQVFEYLWPDLDEERAKNNLYVAWSTMKSVLMGPGSRGPCPYAESVGGVCRTVRDTVRSDIDEFEELLVHARDAEVAGQAREALSAYERISSIYRGDLLPGDCYDDWFSTFRDHYRISFVDAMLRATQLLVDTDDPGNALTFVRRAIQCDPFREDLYQCALRCQIAAGQRSSAIDTYFQLRSKLADELGLDPSAETKALYEQILAMEDRPGPMPLDPLAE